MTSHQPQPMDDNVEGNGSVMTQDQQVQGQSENGTSLWGGVVNLWHFVLERCRQFFSRAVHKSIQILLTISRGSSSQTGPSESEHPEITDMRDENRPAKLLKQLYEEEWQDAHDFLTEKRRQDSLESGAAIDLLLAWLKRCNETCTESLKRQPVVRAHLVFNPANMEIDYWKILSVNSNNAKSAQMPHMYNAGQVPGAKKPAIDCSKILSANANTAKSGKMSDTYDAGQVPGAKKPADILSAVNKDNQFQEDVLQNTSVQAYLEKCFRTCWLMQVQNPPMLIDFETTPGADFDHNVFETYTNRGAKISRVVWPPVYLHKDGPLVCKGYADGTK